MLTQHSLAFGYKLRALTFVPQITPWQWLHLAFIGAGSGERIAHMRTYADTPICIDCGQVPKRYQLDSRWLLDHSPERLQDLWDKHIAERLETMRLWSLVFEERACVTSLLGFYRFKISIGDFITWKKGLAQQCVATLDYEGRMYWTTIAQIGICSSTVVALPGRWMVPRLRRLMP